MSACPICRGSAAEFLIKDGHALSRCAECDLVFMDPLPLPAYLRDEVYSPAAGYHADLTAELASLPTPAWWHRAVEQVGAATPGRRLLDVGCSHGAFLHYAKARGFVGRGVELNPVTAGIARRNGLRVEIGTLDDVELEEASFDVIWLGDVIEHVVDPRRLLAHCRRLIAPGGVVAISTPNLDCAWARVSLGLQQHLGLPASVVTPPHHTFQFSEGNLRLLLLQAGFAVESVWYRPPPSLRYELQSTHLLGSFRRGRSLRNLARLVFGFTLYALCYAACRGTAFLRPRDFSLQVVARPVEREAA